MRRLSISEVCDLLKVKPHVLRYWERQVSLLQPAKSASGRREYSMRDVELLFRLKYLLTERKFTLDGAVQKLIEEASGEQGNAKSSLQALRTTLLDATRRLRAVAETIARVNLGEAADAEARAWLESRPPSTFDPESPRPYTRIPSPGAGVGPGTDDAPGAGVGAGTDDAPGAGVGAGGHAQPGARMRTGVNAASNASPPARGPYGAVISLSPNWNLSPGESPVLEPVLPGRESTPLDMVAEQVRLLAGAGSVPPRVGDRPLAGDRSDHTPPPWLILVPSRVAHLVASYVGERGYFGLDPEAVTVVGLPDLEAEATRDAGVTGAAGAAAPEVYSSPMAVAWALIAAGRLTVPGGDGTLLWLPLAAPFEAAPADNVLRRHREAGAGVTAFAWEYRRGGGEAPPRSDAARLIPTGVMLCNRGTVGTIAEALTVRSLALRRDLILPPGPADLLSRNGDGSGWARGLAYVGVPEIVAAAGNGRIVARGGRPPAFVRTRGEAQQCRIQRGRRQSEVE